MKEGKMGGTVYKTAMFSIIICTTCGLCQWGWAAGLGELASGYSCTIPSNKTSVI
jgi:hypothetical protein